MLPAEVQFINQEIKGFTRTSLANRMPSMENQVMFDEPLIQYADGDDALFAKYKSIIGPVHLTPREALAKALDKSAKDLPAKISVISWILPITASTREANRAEKLIPSRVWAYTRWYGEKFNDALRAFVVNFLTERHYLAVAPSLQPYFQRFTNEKGFYSNWSERHVAYAAGLGTFSLSDGFITERGIAHRCGSVVTDFPLPASPRVAQSPYSNCLFYADGSCKICISRCPVGAISEGGHDKIKCRERVFAEFAYLKEEYNVGVVGCGLCQTKVPCESRNPAKKLKKKKTD